MNEKENAVKIEIPELSVVVLIGPSGAGKSTFAENYFLPTQVLSSDTFRGLLSDDPNDQSVTEKAFETLQFVAKKRLEIGKPVVIDATNVNRESRSTWVRLAKSQHCPAIAIVLDTDFKTCELRNKKRSDRNFGRGVLRSQFSSLRQSGKKLRQEGFRYVYRVNPELIQQERVHVEYVPLWSNKKGVTGPFDIIGDLHGCYEECRDLLNELGYQSFQMADDQEGGNRLESVWGKESFRHPGGRKAVFVGDLVDRGPSSLDCVRLVRIMVQSGDALCVCGNHDAKVARWLSGKNVNVSKGLETTVGEFEKLDSETCLLAKTEMHSFLDSLISHYVLDGGNLVVAHAGLKEDLQGRASGRVREFCLFGDTDGTKDSFGMPNRKNWAAEYRGQALVVYGHTPVAFPYWENNTVNIDTGCVFGGKLTALRYPELQTIAVPSKEKYFEPGRPFIDPVKEYHGSGLTVQDFLGKQTVTSRYFPRITLTAEQTQAAFEQWSRFAIDPKLLVHLPATMSPSPMSTVEGFLEHPRDVWEYYKKQGVETVICQKKHMGSRMLALVFQNEKAAIDRFGLDPSKKETKGCLYSKNGRQFFKDDSWTNQVLQSLQESAEKSGLFEKLNSPWVLLDCELMPWNAKADQLIQNQYAAVAESGGLSLKMATDCLKEVKNRVEVFPSEQRDMVEELFQDFEERKAGIEKFDKAYRAYLWEANSPQDLRVAPFHVLAAENFVGDQKDHLWHIQQLGEMCQFDPMLTETEWLEVELANETQQVEAEKWWMNHVENQGEGMVVKPRDWINFHKGKLVQPAIKCRGPEYLRIIYGPGYRNQENLSRLKKRSTSRKQTAALRQFALGLEALYHLVQTRNQSLMERCVFGILALNQSQIDPRL